jgi:hypothetical protein
VFRLRLNASRDQQDDQYDDELKIFLHIISLDRIYRIIRIIFFATFLKKVAKPNPPAAEKKQLSKQKSTSIF